MTIPPHIRQLHTAVSDYIRAAIDHEEYVIHSSPQSSIDAAYERAVRARDRLDGAIGACQVTREKTISP
jgi:hypothetical protein